MMLDVGSQKNLVIIFTFNLPEGTYLSGHVYSCISADNEGKCLVMYVVFAVGVGGVYVGNIF